MNNITPTATSSIRAPAGVRLRQRLAEGRILPAIGVYDIFSATLAAQHAEAVFCSGYGFSASFYGLPDEGFITWTDMLHYVERMRTVLPDTHIVVDIDDGYGDAAVAANVVRRLEAAGASAVIFEDQKRPKKCGHLPGKEIAPLDDYLQRLKAVLDARTDLVVVARTDAEEFEEGLRRARAFTEAGADAVMVEGLVRPEQVIAVDQAVAKGAYVTVNLLQGGKTPPVTLTELSRLGANLVIYSTPCLFAAHEAIDDALRRLTAADGKLASDFSRVDLKTSNAVLKRSGGRPS